MSNGKGKSKAGVIILLAIVAVVAFVACATVDSCKRHADTKPCFGSSSQR